MKGIFFSRIIKLVTCLCIALPVMSQNSALKTIIIDPGHGLPDPGAQGHNSNESDIALAVAKKLVARLHDSLPGVQVLMTRNDRNLPAGLQNKNTANRWRAKFANENHGDLFISIHCNDAGSIHHSEVTGHRTKVWYTGKGKNRKRHTRRVPTYKYWTTPNPAVGTETYVWAVNKNDDKQQFVRQNHDSADISGEKGDSGENYFNTPEEKIMAALRTKKYFSRSMLLANLIENEYTKEGRTSRGVKQRDDEGIWVLQATAMPSILTEIGFLSNSQEEDYINSQAGQDQVSGAIFRAVLQYKTQLDAGRVQ